LACRRHAYAGAIESGECSYTAGRKQRGDADRGMFECMPPDERRHSGFCRGVLAARFVDMPQGIVNTGVYEMSSQGDCIAE
jgi:hypothetical protein